MLGALASGLFFVQTGLSQNDRFLQKPDAVKGQEVLAEAFSAGATSPATVVAKPADADAVVEAATDSRASTPPASSRRPPTGRAST